MNKFSVKAHASFVGEYGYNYHARGFLTHLSHLTNVFVRNFSHDINAEKNLSEDEKKILVERTVGTMVNGERKTMTAPMAWRDHIPEHKTERTIDIVLNTVNHPYFYQHELYKDISVAYNVWESTKYPDDFFEIIKKFTEIWVPTKWQKNNIINQGLHPEKIKIVHEGVNADCIPGNPNNKQFIFFHAGRWEDRKSTKEIISSFLKAFPKDKDVRLLLSVDNPFMPGFKNADEILKREGINDSRIINVGFQSREEYIKTLQSSNCYVSCAKGEGWNIPLAEAIACGVPTIASNCSGQLEFCEGISHLVDIKGHTFIKDFPGKLFLPDFDHLTALMEDVKYNYDLYKGHALIHSYSFRQKFSWDKIARDALILILDLLNRNESKFVYKFFNTPTTEIVNTPSDSEFEIEFKDTSVNKILHNGYIGNNQWINCYKEYYVPWEITTKKDGKILDKHFFNLTGKDVLIKIDSKAIGDTIAWFPYAEEFRKKHKCKLKVGTFWRELFEPCYPDIEFVSTEYDKTNVFACFHIGYFKDDKDHNKTPVQDIKKIPLQQISSSILGLEHKEIKPKISYKQIDTTDEYICMGMQSTAQAKYWNYDNGWEILSNKLIEKGYKIKFIDKHSAYGLNPNINIFPKGENIEDLSGNELSFIISTLKNAKAFVGLSSGLSWLAWVLDVPLVMISGLTLPFNEMSENDKVHRLINYDVCNGCWHKHQFDPADWLWCPEHKNTERHFECSKIITPDNVMDALNTMGI